MNINDRAYKEQTVAEVTVQTARFLKVYEEYKKAPEVTRKRMYLETMERTRRHRQDHTRQQAWTGGRTVPVPRPAAQALVVETVWNLDHSFSWSTMCRTISSASVTIDQGDEARAAVSRWN